MKTTLKYFYKVLLSITNIIEHFNFYLILNKSTELLARISTQVLPGVGCQCQSSPRWPRSRDPSKTPTPGMFIGGIGANPAPLNGGAISSSISKSSAPPNLPLNSPESSFYITGSSSADFSLASSSGYLSAC